MKLTHYLAKTFSKDPSTQVGCIILNPETFQILSTGYNGFVRGMDDQKKERWERPLKYKFAEHAERNAIYNSARTGTPIKDGIAIISLFPCVDCVRGLIQAGIKEIITLPATGDQINRWKSDFDLSHLMLQELDIPVRLLRWVDIDERDKKEYEQKRYALREWHCCT